MNQTEWILRGRQLARAQQSSNWQLGDWMADGEQYFETKTAAYDAAQKATGKSRGILYRHAMLSRHYAPALRFDSITFFSYYQLKPFPIEFTSRFLPTVADKDLTCGQILTRAVAEFGNDPAPRRHHKPAKFHPVRVYAGLYNALAERAQAQQQSIQAFIQQVLEEFLVGSPVERQPMSNLRTNAWREKVRNAGVMSEEDALGVTEDEGKSSDDAQPRPESEEKRSTYSERREQQLRDGAEPIARKERKPSKLRMLWTECRGESFTDTENGAVKFRAPSSERPTKFFSEADAIRAEAEHFKESGYHERVVLCPSCSLQASSSRRKRQVFHVKHVFSGSPEVRQQHAHA